MTNFLFKISLSVLLISATMPTASAQSRQAQDTAGAIGNLFGALAKAGAKSKAQKAWAQIGEPIKACLNTTLESKKITVEQLVAAGIAPSNDQIAQLVTSCNQIMAAQLQTNIPCNVTNSKGQQVVSTCNQVFAKDENGQIFEVSRDDFLRAAGNGEKVQIAVLELSSANSARLAEEQRLAELERQAIRASQEGKRQAAARVANARANSGRSVGAPPKSSPKLQLKSPAGLWTFVVHHKSTYGLNAKQYIGRIERDKEGDIFFGSLVIPDNNEIQVPMFNGKGGYTVPAAAYVVYGWAVCKKNLYRYNKIDYYRGPQNNYKFFISYADDTKILNYNSVFSNLQSSFLAKDLLDTEDEMAVELKRLCM